MPDNKVLLITLALALASSAALAAGSLNQFRLNGDGKLYCDAGEGSSIDSDRMPCLHMGRVAIGDPRATVERRLGPPQKEKTVSGVHYFIYVIEPFYEVKDFFPYWVISYKNDRVDTLQATGLAIPPNLQFAGLHFNDDTQQVEAILGKPKRVFTRSDNGNEVWDYTPVPISIEFKDAHVFSIRITAP